MVKFDARYGGEHHHSALKFVTPLQRYRGEDIALLACREALYQAVRAANPARWSGSTRNLKPTLKVPVQPPARTTI
ncbi:MAG: hypothetical protein WAT23_12610 [Chromatiaceae bacterium]